MEKQEEKEKKKKEKEDKKKKNSKKPKEENESGTFIDIGEMDELQSEEHNKFRNNIAISNVRNVKSHIHEKIEDDVEKIEDEDEEIINMREYFLKKDARLFPLEKLLFIFFGFLGTLIISLLKGLKIIK